MNRADLDACLIGDCDDVATTIPGTEMTYDDAVISMQSYPHGQVFGDYLMDPLIVDEVWFIEGVDPLPLRRADLARFVASIDRGGASVVLAKEEQALATVRSIIELMTKSGGRA